MGRRCTGYEEPSFFGRKPDAPSADLSDAVAVTVLWFNQNKGFGFVQPGEGEKAFLDIRQLEAAGLKSIHEGAELRKVQWYNAVKGFGFIGREDGGKDVFVHASALRASCLPDLQEGQAVMVRSAQGPKGPEARSVWLR